MSPAVILYSKVEKLMPGTEELNTASRYPVRAVEHITGLLATSDSINWKRPLYFPFYWTANTQSGQLFGYHDVRLGLGDFATFQIIQAFDETTQTSDRSRWEFVQPELVRGLLGLWLHTLGRRRAAL